MIFQLSDWFLKPMIWAIIVKFDQIRKNWWRISCAESLEVVKIFFATSSILNSSSIKIIMSWRNYPQTQGWVLIIIREKTQRLWRVIKWVHKGQITSVCKQRLTTGDNLSKSHMPFCHLAKVGFQWIQVCDLGILESHQSVAIWSLSVLCLYYQMEATWPNIRL